MELIIVKEKLDKVVGNDEGRATGGIAAKDGENGFRFRVGLSGRGVPPRTVQVVVVRAGSAGGVEEIVGRHWPLGVPTSSLVSCVVSCVLDLLPLSFSLLSSLRRDGVEELRQDRQMRTTDIDDGDVEERIS